MIVSRAAIISVLIVAAVIVMTSRKKNLTPASVGCAVQESR